MFLKRPYLLLIILSVLGSQGLFAAEPQKPVVLVSIKPLAMIVEGVTGEAFEVDTLLPASVSPHSYTLKFSDIQRIRRANLALWVGPELESSLAKPLSARISRKAVVIRATELLDIHWPAEDSAQDKHAHDHPARSRDPHIWLNPQNALIVAQTVVDRLSELYPGQAPQLKANYRRFAVDIMRFEQISAEKAWALRGQGFLVMHDGYGHLVNHYQLKQLGAVRLPSGGQRGLKHRAGLLKLKDQVQCVFSEPQWPTDWAEQIARPLNARVGVLDPMGYDISPDENAYLEFMQNLFSAMENCLLKGQ